MTSHRRSVVRRFADRDRELLIKLFRQLGTDNPHEAEAVRGTIDNFLRRFNQSGADLIRLLGGTPTSIRADLAGDISALFSGNPDERGRARRNIDDLLLRHRKRWNDLVDELISIAPAAWVSGSATDDPPRVNPLELICHLLREYVALREPHGIVSDGQRPRWFVWFIANYFALPTFRRPSIILVRNRTSQRLCLHEEVGMSGIRQPCDPSPANSPAHCQRMTAHK